MLKKLKTLLPKGEFSKNVLTLMTGTTIAQAIPIAISPILTRIYTPEDFGVVALFVAITTILGSIANGRYELAIMLPEKDEDAINIFALGFILTTALSFLTLLIVVFFHDYLVRILNNKEISFWLYFIPVVVFLIGFYNILNYYNNRNKNYKDIAKSKIVKAIVSSIIQLSVGFIKQGATGLFSGQIISNFSANATLLKNIIKDKVLLSRIRKPKIIALAKKYKDFPKFSMLSTLLNTLSLQSINILISSFYSITTLGFYSLVNRVIGLPASLIGGSIAQVFFQEATIEFQKYGNTNSVFLKTLKKMILIAIPIFIIMFFTVEPIFAFVFGEKWRIAGVYARILIPLASARFISGALSTIITIHQKLFYGLLINTLLLTTAILVFFIGKHFHVEFKQILTYFSLILSIEYLLFLVLYFNLSKNNL